MTCDPRTGRNLLGCWVSRMLAAVAAAGLSLIVWAIFRNGGPGPVVPDYVPDDWIGPRL